MSLRRCAHDDIIVASTLHSPPRIDEEWGKTLPVHKRRLRETSEA
jgi:hypothetical protein